MIPKKIHYCWFGGAEKNELVKKCIDSWKKYCPDYEIIEWNESNYDINRHNYMKEAYQNKKWAFVSDYARLDIIYSHGGFYLDTDVELVKSLDSLCDLNCFLAVESTNYINTGLGFGAEKNSEVVKTLLEEYKGIHFLISKGIYDDLPCPRRNTAPFIRHGFDKNTSEIQYILGATIYPKEYFCPLDYETKNMNITENTISIHHFNGTWTNKNMKDFLKGAPIKVESRLKGLVSKNYFEYRQIYEKKTINNFTIFLTGKMKKKFLNYKRKKYYDI